MKSTKICTIPGCDKPFDSRGLCSGHRSAAFKAGTLKPLPKPTPEERFWAKVDRRGIGECWPWTGAVKDNGYAQFSIQKRPIMGHRYAYELANGPIPEGLMIDHLCHNRACVNPAHLRAVTMKQNQEHRQGARADSTSGILGVHWSKGSKAWIASAVHNQKYHHGGVYKDKAEAAEAAAELRRRLFTHNDRDRQPSA